MSEEQLVEIIMDIVNGRPNVRQQIRKRLAQIQEVQLPDDMQALNSIAEAVDAAQAHAGDQADHVIDCLETAQSNLEQYPGLKGAALAMTEVGNYKWKDDGALSAMAVEKSLKVNRDLRDLVVQRCGHQCTDKFACVNMVKEFVPFGEGELRSRLIRHCV